MTKDNQISLLSNDKIELHYWFKDGSHLMDAFIQNKCEYELLGIIREISSAFNVDIIIETEPIGEGGLRRWFKLTSREENKKAAITQQILILLIVAVVVTPIAKTVEKTVETIFEKVFEDKELKDLEKEQIKENIEKIQLEKQKIKQEITINAQKIDSSNAIKKKKSNFYEALDKYPKVDKVTFLVIDEESKSVKDEKNVEKKDFKNFILITDELAPVELDDVVIEIISPILKKGKYKWMGYYEGEPTHFSMKSKEFKEAVQNGDVQFKNGTTINCQIQIKKKIDNEGIEKVTAIEVVRVNSYYENEAKIETAEGKKHRKEKEADKAQLKLFAQKEDDENNEKKTK